VSNTQTAQQNQAVPQSLQEQYPGLDWAKVESVKDLGALKKGKVVEITDDYIKAKNRRRLIDILVTATAGLATTTAAGIGGYHLGYNAGLEAAAENEANVTNLDERRATHG
jgi:hypothetical protein